MSTYRLRQLFAPRSVALIGASRREGSLGRIILENLREGGFEGAIHLVNPRYNEIDGIACVARIEDLGDVPDLVIVTAPPQAVPGIVAAAGPKGAPGAIIITAGLQWAGNARRCGVAGGAEVRTASGGTELPRRSGS